MWLERLVKCIRSHPGPIILEGGEAYGAPYLIEALSRTEKLVWLSLTPADANDFVAQGNRLAEAVNEALGATLLPHALPYTYGLEVLKSHLPLLGPLTIALSNADYSPLLSEALLKLNIYGTKVLLDTTAANMAPPEDALYLRPPDLALSQEEAAIIAGNVFEPELVTNLWRSTDGAYLTFVSGLERLKGQRPPLVPAPRTLLTAPGEEVLVSTASLLEVLRRAGRYVEALDLAVMSLPERVPEVLKDAGPAYQERGLLGRLRLLLESLDATYQANEEVLLWRLATAFRAGQHGQLLPEIEAYLAQHEAPSLRAIYAGVIAGSTSRLDEAKRAATSQPSPLTLFQYGRVHPDPEEGVALLRKSVRLAERHGKPYEVARNAGALGEKLIYQGRFKEAVTWTEWALRYFDRHGLKDGQRRLLLVNNWAFARILTGQTVGLHDELRLTQEHLDSALPEYAMVFRSTLAELELVLGNLAEAERLTTENLWQSPRLYLGQYAVPLVRVLLEKGDVRAALAEGQRVLSLTAGEADLYHLPSLLAFGMALALYNPKHAVEPLTRVMNAAELPADYRAIATLHLLFIEAEGGQSITLESLPENLRSCLMDLSVSGLKLFCGPETLFSRVWAQVLREEAPLHIRVLGDPQVWFEGERLELSDQALEILALLALSPDGLSPEPLHTQLYGDDNEVKLVSLRSAVSRLRHYLPISMRPYKLTTPFRFDVDECRAHVAAGRVRQALEVYRGPLLPTSDAPGIRAAREHLEEHLRQAALQSADPEVLIALGNALVEDVEVWLAARHALGASDPRLPLVRAHLEKLSREFA